MDVAGGDGHDHENNSNSFDLATFISPSSGHGRIQKLIFIAQSSKGNAVELQALKMAHDLSKKVVDAMHGMFSNRTPFYSG